MSATPAIFETTFERDLFGNATNHDAVIDQDALGAALGAMLSKMTLEQFRDLIVNEFEAVTAYAELAAGKKAGNDISLLYNPHRLNTARGRAGSRGARRHPGIFDSLSSIGFAAALARACVVVIFARHAKKELLPVLRLGVNGRILAQEFPPSTARDLCREHGVTKESRVLDPCAGWGGRMLGVSVVCDTYHACEPSTLTHAGLVRMASEFIAPFNPAFAATVECLPYEDSTLGDGYDFALTSPPYYDTERYSDEPTNSCNRYATFDAWCAGFYVPMLQGTMRRLKPGAAFVVNVGSRLYPLGNVMREAIGVEYDIERMAGRLMQRHRRDDEGEAFYRITKRTGARM